jgi:glycosyltransferase involved in cell wall biosynthesis
MNFLEENNYKITYSYLINERNDIILYKKGRYIQKLFIGIKAIFIRLRDVLRANKYDIILVYREAHFVGSCFFEKQFAKSRAKLVFDFDDAIWLNDTSEANSNLKWLKNPAKIGSIIEISDLVIVGNSYLAEYANIFNQNVLLIPTTIDTTYHKIEREYSPKDKICIGWTGSSTTIKHFEQAIPFLVKLKDKYKGSISFKIIVDMNYEVPELDLKSTLWNVDTEIEELSKIDIGIMPLPNDLWSKGKCGFKGIQYMALEIPTVMSPVGVNTEIITDGENGFLADTDDEWIEKLSLLIESEELRRKFGANGKHTIEQSYSLNSQKNIFVNALDKLINNR